MKKPPDKAPIKNLRDAYKAPVDGGENPRMDGAVASLAASSGLVETMMARG